MPKARAKKTTGIIRAEIMPIFMNLRDFGIKKTDKITPIKTKGTIKESKKATPGNTKNIITDRVIIPKKPSIKSPILFPLFE